MELNIKKILNNFLKKNIKLGSYFSIALLAQLAYWHLGSPGPSLLGSAERTLNAALINIASALLFLFLLPLLTLKFFKHSLKDLGFSWGNFRLGAILVLVISPIALLLMYIGSANLALQNTYPWAGPRVGSSFIALLTWAACYALYYLSFEFFYRGFILKGFAAEIGLTQAMWLQVTFSVMIHLGKPPAETIAAIPAGFGFGLLALKTSSLLYPILLHLIIGISTDIFSLLRQGLLFH